MPNGLHNWTIERDLRTARPLIYALRPAYRWGCASGFLGSHRFLAALTPALSLTGTVRDTDSRQKYDRTGCDQDKSNHEFPQNGRVQYSPACAFSTPRLVREMPK